MPTALTKKQLRRCAHRSTRELDAAICTYPAISNEQPEPFVWTKSADQILATIAPRQKARMQRRGPSSFGFPSLARSKRAAPLRPTTELAPRHDRQIRDVSETTGNLS